MNFPPRIGRLPVLYVFQVLYAPACHLKHSVRYRLCSSVTIHIARTGRIRPIGQFPNAEKDSLYLSSVAIRCFRCFDWKRYGESNRRRQQELFFLSFLSGFSRLSVSPCPRIAVLVNKCFSGRGQPSSKSGFAYPCILTTNYCSRATYFFTVRRSRPVMRATSW